MPLGKSVGKNIKTLVSEGYSKDQAVAIAMKEKRKQKHRQRKKYKRK